MKLLYDEKDDFSRQSLYKHYYMFEVCNIYLDKSVKTPTSKYSDIKISVTEAQEAVFKNHQLNVDTSELAAMVANLCLQKYLTMESTDGKITMYHTITEQGMIAITSSLFLREFEARQRDLLQARLAESQITFSRRSLLLAGISTLFILITIFQQCGDKTEQRLKDMQSTMKDQSSKLESIRLSLEKTNSSIQTLRIDTPISVRVKK